MRLTAQKNTWQSNLGWTLVGGLAILGATGCFDPGSSDVSDEEAKASTFTNKVIMDWSAHTRAALFPVTGNQDPLVGTRTLAMVHIAMHDAVNAVNRVYQPYTFTGRDSQANPVAAAASAAHFVLVGLFPDQAADLDAKLNASLAEVANGTSENRGVTLGEQAGKAILALRANDGSDAVLEYTTSTGPGKYQFVPPFEGFIFRPEWRFVTPFVLTSPSQFRPAAPPSLTSSLYRDHYNEVKRSGILSGSDRTADESVYAKFWYEDSDIGWNSITRDVVVRKNLTLNSAARLFALVNMALADGYTAGWDAKFTYDFWRPFTAIRAGATDGNPGTNADTSWVPFLDTPPVQDYPSTHSSAGAAAAAVLGRVLGDRTTFSFKSSTADDPNLARTYSSFSAAAFQNADSRVQAGIHFRFSSDVGRALGDKVGNRAYDNFLRPLSN